MVGCWVSFCGVHSPVVLCDSIGCFTYTLTRPLGFDYSHVYELQLDAGGEERDTTHSYIEKVLMVRDRLRWMDKVVEAVGLHYSSDPMGASNRWSAFSVMIRLRFLYVMP